MKSRGRIFFRSFLVLMVVCQLFSLTAYARFDQAEGSNVQVQSNGSWAYQYERLYGDTGHPYPTDGQEAYLNQPAGMYFIADTLFVTEEMGRRASFFDTTTGERKTTAGTAGTQDLFYQPMALTVYDFHLWVADWKDLQVFSMMDEHQYVFSYKDLSSNPAGFNCAADVAFDSAGHLFVAQTCDSQNILIFNVSGTMPNYELTLQGKIEGAGFNDIRQIDIGTFTAGTETLYVAEAGGSRVQACTESGGTWTCTEFAGSDQLSRPMGVTFWNNHLYIADTDHQRIRQCSADKSCVDFIANSGGQTPLSRPRDIVFDGSGNAYVSDAGASVVKKFSQADALPKTAYTVFAGTLNTPYATDMAHFNAPVGVYAGANGSMIVTEEESSRVRKLDAEGNSIWSFGVAGQDGNDSSHLARPGGKVAVDSTGKIYVPDTGNQRVVLLKSDGTYLSQFVKESDPGKFEQPVNVAVTSGGQLFVLDSARSLVQVFTIGGSGFQYQSTIGTVWTEEAPKTDGAFVGPMGMAVAGDTLVYIADTGHQRVQKCTRTSLTATTWTCTNFAGVTNDMGNDNTRLANPNSVSVDGNGNVFVADSENQRVQIFNQAGNYLATVGGTWGNEPGQFNSLSSVFPASNGDLYITDKYNYRVQKFIDPTKEIFLPLVRK